MVSVVPFSVQPKVFRPAIIRFPENREQTPKITEITQEDYSSFRKVKRRFHEDVVEDNKKPFQPISIRDRPAMFSYPMKRSRVLARKFICHICNEKKRISTTYLSESCTKRTCMDCRTKNWKK